MKRALFPLLFGSLIALSGAVEERPNPLAHQATVITPSGKVYKGWLDGYRHDRVRLRLPADQGEVVYQFSRDEIRSLIFPDTEAIEETLTTHAADPTEPTIDLLEDTWGQRAPYLPVLDRRNRAPLLLYAESLLETDRGLESITRARRLAGIDLDPDEKERMNRVIIRGYEQTGLHDEAKVLAEGWCRTHLPSGSSALGWAVLARQALREENWEEALWFGLHPVAFGHDTATVDLAACYGAAVAATLKLEDHTEAVNLVNEMRRRGISWPRSEPLLAAAGALIASARDPANEPSNSILSDQNDGPPIPDPWLTLEAIRRVLAKPGP